MKISYSTFAFLLLACAPLYSMKKQAAVTIFDALADAAENGGVTVSFNKYSKKAPSAMTMERTHKKKTPEKNGTDTPEKIAESFSQISTTNGSDEYDQADSADAHDESAKVVSSPVEEIFEEHKVKKHSKKRKSASHRIVKLFKNDEEKIKEQTTKKNPFKKISAEQCEILSHYYRHEATLEELRKLYFYLKEKLSTVSIVDKKKLSEFALCTTAYNTIKVVHFNGNKTETKAFLFAAGYESDEEEIVKTGLQGDADPLYRLSKKLLTNNLPELAQEKASREKAIALGILKKAKLEKELKEINDALKTDNTEKGYISRSIGIIEKNRKQQKNDLLVHEAFLQEEINSLTKDIDNLDEEAILGNAHHLSEQKKEMETRLSTTRKQLKSLQANLPNFDTPTGYFSSYRNNK